jgi:putative protease
LTIDNPRDERVFLPISELNELRRELVSKLMQRRADRRPLVAGLSIEKAIGSFLGSPQKVHAVGKRTNGELVDRLHVLVRTPEQLTAAIECRPDTITLDYLELYGLRPSVEAIREAGLVPRVASPRILKPAEQNVVRFLLSLNCAILVRSAGLLHDLIQLETADRPKLIGDFSLNCANAVSARLLLDMGLAAITPTHDLNAEQIATLAGHVDPGQLEVIVYQHLPVFHMEHCVFCRFLSKGTDNTNCGHPCERHVVALRDQNGREHPVLADIGCRNTVFGSQAQIAARYLAQWRTCLLRDFRIEFADEDAAQVRNVVAIFRRSQSHALSGNALAAQLKISAPHGVTDGSLIVIRSDQKS